MAKLEMRKKLVRLTVVLFCLIPMLVLFLAPVCASEADSTYVVDRDGISFTVNPESRTITVDGYSYHYEVETSGEQKTTTITYPNGATFYWVQEEYVGYGGWSDDYDPDTYMDGDILLDIVDQIRPAKEKIGDGIEINLMNVLIGLVVFVLGIFTAANPEDAWYWSNGWRFKNAEPSDMALTMSQFGGIVMIIGGILIIGASILGF